MSRLRDMTWGISSGQFALAYGAALLALVVMLGVRRLRLLNPKEASARRTSRALSGDAVAYLSGGLSGLANSALGALRERGEISFSTRLKVVAEPVRLSAEATPTQRALHEALLDRGRYPVGEVTALIRESPAVAQLRRSLADAQLSTEGSMRTQIRRGALLYLALFAVGVARLIASTDDHAPLTYLVLLMIATAIVGLLSLRVPPLTAAGDAALRSAGNEQQPTPR